MNLTRVQKQFEGFMKACYPDGVGKQQHSDLRRAFFGGAAILFEEIGKSGDDDLTICAELEVEFAQFAVDLASGKA